MNWLQRFLSIRFEDGPWPLARVDKGIRYGAKAMLHDRWGRPGDAEYFRRSHSEFADLPARSKSPSVQFSAVGDFMWIPRGWDAPVSPSLARLFEGSDLTFLNLETPVDPRSPVPRFTYARFNAPAHLPTVLRRELGPAVCSLSNNHALDQGPSGLANTRRRIAQEPGLTPVGGTELGHRTCLVQAGKLTVGVLAMTYGINPWFHDLKPSDHPEGVLLARFGSENKDPPWDTIAEHLGQLREAGADLLVVMPHWGFEFEYWPAARQRKHAARLVRLGADVVIGSSPHVVQPMELVSVNGAEPGWQNQVQRSGPSGHGLVIYSLGNFTSSMPTAGCNTSAVASFQISRSPDGQLGIAGFRITPTVSQHQGGVRTTVLLSEVGARRQRDALRHLERLPLHSADDPREAPRTP